MGRAYILALLLVTIVAVPAALSQKTDSGDTASKPTVVAPVDLSGDRISISSDLKSLSLDDSTRSAYYLSPDYLIGPGDLLVVDVRGRVDLHYGREKSDSDTLSPSKDSPISTFPVLYDGTINLPVIGPVDAAGKTVPELKEIVKDKLSAYYKHFDVDISVSKPATIKVWISGMIANPGPQVLPSSATLLEALLKAVVQPTGSTRRVKLTRNGKSNVVDVFRMVSRGELEANVTLQGGDIIYVPPALDWVTVVGEVSRQGQFEMVPLHPADGKECHVSDVMDLCQGLLPTASGTNAVIRRNNPDGSVKAIHIDLSGNDNPALQPGDKLVIPSIADYQPMIRLVGEFKGDGVYQRVSGNVLNKSGVYRLANGETAGDVIVRTGGATPQADLKHAKIERRSSDKTEVIALDLDRVITRQDKSGDVVLESGDTLILPALQDKVYVFGEVVKPGGFSYEPDGRLLDYLAQAGGPGGRAKSSIVIVRATSNKNELIKADIAKGIRGKAKDNPVMQPGDIVYVSEKIVSDWRDLSQIISTIRLLALF
ncbi:MAG: polysaccharide biosynthesis/export family protein [Armatimonadota bacterium]